LQRRLSNDAIARAFGSTGRQAREERWPY
jgi:hypothetical protein